MKLFRHIVCMYLTIGLSAAPVVAGIEMGHFNANPRWSELQREHYRKDLGRAVMAGAMTTIAWPILLPISVTTTGFVQWGICITEEQCSDLLAVNLVEYKRLKALPTLK